MKMNNTVSGSLSLGSVLTQEKSLLPESDYDFMISGVRIVDFHGKIGDCKKVILTLSIFANEATVDIRTDLILHENFRWKIEQFFSTIGRIAEDGSFILDFNGIIGLSGKGHVIQKTYKKHNGSDVTENDVSYYIRRN